MALNDAGFNSRRSRTCFRNAVLLPIFLVFCFAFPSNGQEAGGLLERMRAGLPTNRVTVALATLENATGDTNLDHWRFTASALLAHQLGLAKALRLLPQASLKYGLNQLHKRPGERLDAKDAASLGELVEARRVVWGSYRREAGKWKVTVRALNVSDGTVSTELSASSADWFALRDELVKKILAELGVKTEPSERRRMQDRSTGSAAALEWLARARAASEERRPVTELQGYAQRASEADPRCAEALAALALGLSAQGKLEEALAKAREAIRLKPDLAMGYTVLGYVMMQSQRIDDAEAPLTRAAGLDPDDPSRLGRLAEYYLLRKKTDDAIQLFEEALRLGPFQSALHANLGRAWLMGAKREAPLEQMHLAERLSFEPDLNTEEYLSWGYEKLHDAPAAIDHYEKALTIARQIGLSSERIKDLERDLANLRATLSPNSVNATEPKAFDEKALEACFESKLSAEQRTLLVRPLATTAEISGRARELTASGMNELQRARLVFDALAGHLDAGESELRTAAEVFEAWKSPQASFTCQEYALLYTTMARAVGVRAYVVAVARDFQGESVSHACAAVFTDGKAWLVDPSYRWFGVPHKEFKVMNDLEATAEYLCQSSDLRLRQIAAKLQPESAYVRFKLASKYAVEEQWPEAAQELAVLERLEKDGAHTYCLRAILALHDKKLDETVELATKALQRGWPVHDGFPYFILGRVYYEQGRLSEAREAFRAMLSRAPDEQRAKVARRCIARINEILGND
jgi:tetratricopeptide (TPR) repeat protein